VVLVPCLIYLFRRLLSWWYHRKISRDENKLQKLKVKRYLRLDRWYHRKISRDENKLQKLKVKRYVPEIR
jgi:hypothetical protein